MSIWKAIAGTLIVALAFGLVLEHAPPQQRQMLMCAVTPNCVYVMGVSPSTDIKEQ
ncbi:hypothetical protein [Achromobacter anxifer]|uniref:hypothetical protein n=1 Tax=Achromobacter anxifer TaxID=1287737 RepID=UPI0021580D98|nr:hypothetical protein [Achromobacter anxifer]